MSIKVRQYKRGGWEVDIRVWLPDGTEVRDRHRSPVTGKAATERWAKEREAEVLLNAKKKQAPAQKEKKPVPTLADFAETWVKDHGEANRQKASTVYAKKSILRKHLVPMLGKKRLDEIGPADVQTIKTRLKNRKPKTVNNVLTVLSKLLKVAADWELIPPVAWKVGLLRVHQEEAEFHDFAAYDQLLQGAKKEGLQAQVVVLLGGNAGLREGEMIGLKWLDIDFDRNQLHVQRSDWYGEVDLPKGGTTRRVPLTHALREALRGLQEERKVEDKEDLRVLLQGEGEPMTPKVLIRTMREIQAAAGMDETGLVHILRHTFCSHLAMRGASASAIQKLAGHQHLTTTMRYMHLSPAAKDQAIDLLNARPGGQAALVEVKPETNKPRVPKGTTRLGDSLETRS